MRTDTRKLSINGNSTKIEFQIYDEKKDIDILKTAFEKWLKLSKIVKKLQGRKLNLPEAVSEAIFCLEMGSARVLNKKYDSINLNSLDREQIKACSVKDDLTSFSPESEWDKLYFMDFFGQSGLDGSYDIYEIPTDKLKNRIVHQGKGETLEDQQDQGRRARLSVKRELIDNFNLGPVKKGSIDDLEPTDNQIGNQESLIDF